VLNVEKISAFYGDVQALRDVSLEVPEKKIVALLGPNAAGKSTTLRAISNVIRIRSGRITFHGERIDPLPLHRIVEMGIIHVPEGRGLSAPSRCGKIWRWAPTAGGPAATCARAWPRRWKHSSPERAPWTAGRIPVGRGTADVLHRPGTHGPAHAAHD